METNFGKFYKVNKLLSCKNVFGSLHDHCDNELWVDDHKRAIYCIFTAHPHCWLYRALY